MWFKVAHRAQIYRDGERDRFRHDDLIFLYRKAIRARDSRLCCSPGCNNGDMAKLRVCPVGNKEDEWPARTRRTSAIMLKIENVTRCHTDSRDRVSNGH